MPGTEFLRTPKNVFTYNNKTYIKEGNLQWLRDNGYRYPAVSREKSCPFDPEQAVSLTFRRADGLTLHVRKATHAEAEQLKIYQALNINPAQGGVKKMRV